MEKWVCITVSTDYHRGDRKAATSLIERIFGEDLKEVLFVCDEVMWKSEEYYCFVRCDNYSNHTSTLRENSLFFHVVPSCDKPDLMTTEDVNKFIHSVQNANKRDEFFRGDIVTIKEGYLKNLCGLVIGRHKKKYRVSFHFCTKKFVEQIPEGYLQFMGSLFKNKRFPVTRRSFEKGHIPIGSIDPELREALKKVASDHKIHWKANRGRIKAK